MDAFEFYYSLGPERSYRQVAEYFEVSKTAIANLAEKERWAERIQEMERKAHAAFEAKVMESIEAMNERHIKVCKLIQAKALETLKSMPLSTASEAVRALDLSIKQERLIRGEPTDRSAMDIQQVIKSEYDRWMGNNPDEYDPNEKFI